MLPMIAASLAFGGNHESLDCESRFLEFYYHSLRRKHKTVFQVIRRKYHQEQGDNIERGIRVT